MASSTDHTNWSDPRIARLFIGTVMHLRLRPRRHQFRQRVTALWIDADRPEAAAGRLFSVDRANLASFHRRDHGPRDGSDLRPWVEARLAEIGAPPPDRIMLLCFPRLLGYVFNPLSVYYCYSEEGDLQSLVYEVKNTFGDQFAYAARVSADAFADAATQRHEKQFFVSPFIDMDKAYYFTAPAPSDRLALRIKERDGAGDYLIATWNGRAAPLRSGAILRLLGRAPLMTFKIMAAIHWHALRLFLKGVPFLGHPGADGVVRLRRPRAEAAAGETPTAPSDAAPSAGP